MADIIIRKGDFVMEIDLARLRVVGSRRHVLPRVLLTRQNVKLPAPCC